MFKVRNNAIGTPNKIVTFVIYFLVFFEIVRHNATQMLGTFNAWGGGGGGGGVGGGGHLCDVYGRWTEYTVFLALNSRSNSCANDSQIWIIDCKQAKFGARRAKSSAEHSAPKYAWTT